SAPSMCAGASQLTYDRCPGLWSYSGGMALMEWEFTSGPDNEGQFMATGKVIETLRRHLARGEIDEAVTLYETCVQETVGQELWQEFTSASTPLKKAIANLFYRARDYRRAAIACEQLGEWGAAARAHAAAYDWIKAAECMKKGGDPIRAAEMLTKGGQPRLAAQLYYEANRLPEAAAALEAAQDFAGAGQLFVRAKNLQRAAQALSRVGMQDPRYLTSLAQLSEVLAGLNRRDLAIQRLAAALTQMPTIDGAEQAEIAFRLGVLQAEEGHVNAARVAFERVRVFDSNYRDVAARLMGLNKSSSASQDMPKVVAGQPYKSAVADPVEALAQDPFVPPSVPDPSTVGNTTGFVQRMLGYGMLKKLPIFEELSLDDMKAFYKICEQTRYSSGEVVIEQGQPGAGLIIVRSGRVGVVRIGDRGEETQLATVPAGQFVGEMSLVDDVPTSARVLAAEAVKALYVSKEHFEHFMFAHERIALRVYRSFTKALGARLRTQNAQRAAAQDSARKG
ncbi:MAG: cyclic nucleotide-binding domain-containing protein, partial [Myxococcota bacterium]